jgi:hypothetical protein
MATRFVQDVFLCFIRDRHERVPSSSLKYTLRWTVTFG